MCGARLSDVSSDDLTLAGERTHSVGTLNDRRHTVMLNSIILPETMPMNGRTVLSEAICHMNFQSVSLKAHQIQLGKVDQADLPSSPR